MRVPLPVVLAVSLFASSCATGVDSGDTPGGDAGTGVRRDAGAGDGAAGTDSGAEQGEAGGSVEAGADEAGLDSSAAIEAGPTLDSGAPHADSGSVKDAGQDSPIGNATCAGHGFTGALVTFDLTSQGGDEPTATATSTAPGVTSGALTRAVSLKAVTGSGSINASGWPDTSSADQTLYYTFTITPASGCSVKLSTLALDLMASKTGPASGDVATSSDAFAGHTASFAGTSTPTADFTAAAATDAVEVRVYGYGASSAQGTLRIQNTMTLSGSVD